MTAAAAEKLVLPACVAWMVQVPAATKVTVAPDTVQTGTVIDAKLTGRKDDAVAETVNGAVPSAMFASAPKVML